MDRGGPVARRRRARSRTDRDQRRPTRHRIGRTVGFTQSASSVIEAGCLTGASIIQDNPLPPRCAEVAKLADALDSGSSARKGVRVQIPPSAPNFLPRCYQGVPMFHPIILHADSRLIVAGLTFSPRRKAQYWSNTSTVKSSSVPPSSASGSGDAQPDSRR